MVMNDGGNSSKRGGSGRGAGAMHGARASGAAAAAAPTKSRVARRGGAHPRRVKKNTRERMVRQEVNERIGDLMALLARLGLAGAEGASGAASAKPSGALLARALIAFVGLRASAHGALARNARRSFP